MNIDVTLFYLSIYSLQGVVYIQDNRRATTHQTLYLNFSSLVSSQCNHLKVLYHNVCNERHANN